MQKDTADIGRRVGHENPRAWEAPHGQRQSADVVLMRVRYQNRLNLAVGDCLEQRQRIFASVFRMHSAVEQEPVRANLHIVRIRADLCVACEINEFQVSESVKALKRSSGQDKSYVYIFEVDRLLRRP